MHRPFCCFFWRLEFAVFNEIKTCQRKGRRTVFWINKGHARDRKCGKLTFSWRVAARRAFLAGWLNQVRTRLFQSLWKWALAKMLLRFPTMVKFRSYSPIYQNKKLYNQSDRFGMRLIKLSRKKLLPKKGKITKIILPMTWGFRTLK